MMDSERSEIDVRSFFGEMCAAFANERATNIVHRDVDIVNLQTIRLSDLVMLHNENANDDDSSEDSSEDSSDANDANDANDDIGGEALMDEDLTLMDDTDCDGANVDVDDTKPTKPKQTDQSQVTSQSVSTIEMLRYSDTTPACIRIISNEGEQISTYFDCEFHHIIEPLDYGDSYVDADKDGIFEYFRNKNPDVKLFLDTFHTASEFVQSFIIFSNFKTFISTRYDIPNIDDNWIILRSEILGITRYINTKLKMKFKDLARLIDSFGATIYQDYESYPICFNSYALDPHYYVYDDDPNELDINKINPTIINDIQDTSIACSIGKHWNFVTNYHPYSITTSDILIQHTFECAYPTPKRWIIDS